MSDLFNLLLAPFNFINSILQSILDIIDAFTVIFNYILELILKITYILPYPLYPCLVAFLGVYLSIIIYKLCRKG